MLGETYKIKKKCTLNTYILEGMSSENTPILHAHTRDGRRGSERGREEEGEEKGGRDCDVLFDG